MEVGNFIQDYKQEAAVQLIQSYDQEVIDHIENLNKCGKGSDASMMFHQEHHKFYQYLIAQINKEFQVVGRNYVSGTPHNFRAGKPRWKTLLNAERRKKWAEATDMLSSPITVWDAIKIMFKGRRNVKSYNRMIRDGNSDGILTAIEGQKVAAEGKLSKASGEAEEYWKNKLRFYDFVTHDVQLRFAPVERSVPLPVAAEAAAAEVSSATPSSTPSSTPSP